jgi:hypothetical protein
MKNVVSLIIALLTLVSAAPGIELLSRIGEVDLDAMDTINGIWVMEDSRYTFEFTNRFACMIDGLKYYHYKRTQSNPAFPWVYTIIKSKKTGRFYFARGEYRKGRFYGSTSRIRFRDKDHFIVYHSDKPEKVYYKAFRIKHKRGKELSQRAQRK